jgi:hypothetical protein
VRFEAEGGTGLLERTDTSKGDDDDFDGYAHYAAKHGLVEAMINGTKVTALCGHQFIPMRDPQGLPVCHRCKKIHEMLPEGED